MVKRIYYGKTDTLHANIGLYMDDRTFGNNSILSFVCYYQWIKKSIQVQNIGQLNLNSEV